MYRCKQQKLFLKKNKVIVIIQKLVRKVLAKAHLRRLRENKATQIIKDVLRMHKMKVNLRKYNENQAAIFIQRIYKGFLARRLFKHMKYIKALVKIQSCWRRALAIRKKKRLRKELTMCFRIQRFWKKRFRMLKAKATQIRAYWKMSKARKSFCKWKKEKYASIKLQAFVRMVLAKIKKKDLLLERAMKEFKHRQRVKYGKVLFSRVQLSKKYTNFFEILNSVIMKNCIKAIKYSGEVRNQKAIIIQGLLKMKKAKIRLRRLRRRKMVVKIQVDSLIILGF